MRTAWSFATKVVSWMMLGVVVAGGLALIVTVAALGLAALAFVPVVGYLLAVGVPALAARLRRTHAERYAGLRSLAKD